MSLVQVRPEPPFYIDIMRTATQTGTVKGLLVLRGAVVDILILLILGIWLMWPTIAMEQYASCDGNYSIWRRNPGAFSSYIYEVRDGVVPIKTGLHTEQMEDFSNKYHCLSLEGG